MYLGVWRRRRRLSLVSVLAVWKTWSFVSLLAFLKSREAEGALPIGRWRVLLAICVLAVPQ
eukprot:COSAG01_NODE_1142_length_11533_cov_9.907381_18_plen_61_part_00